MTIYTILGARPQFIKAKPVSDALKEHCPEYPETVIHTGQHYDYEMSEVFFQELDIPRPAYHLEVGSGTHGYQTGSMLQELEKIMLDHPPQAVMVYGDTNSTLAGALAASKLHLPVYHVESGLRSYDFKMPEEVNRVLTDRLSTLLFCPTNGSLENLRREGLTRGIHLVGDVMYDALLRVSNLAQKRSRILSHLGLNSREYFLATVHRAANTDDPSRLKQIIEALKEAPFPVVLPLHPRTRKKMEEYGITATSGGSGSGSGSGSSSGGSGVSGSSSSGGGSIGGSSSVGGGGCGCGCGGDSSSSLRLLEPLGYLDMLALEENARKIVTDSGGVQKEAFLLEVPCITLRKETEWVETVEAGWNVLVDAHPEQILQALHSFTPPSTRPAFYGDGRAAEKIASIIAEVLERRC